MTRHDAAIARLAELRQTDADRLTLDLAAEVILHHGPHCTRARHLINANGCRAYEIALRFVEAS